MSLTEAEIERLAEKAKSDMQRYPEGTIGHAEAARELALCDLALAQLRAQGQEPVAIIERELDSDEMGPHWYGIQAKVKLHIKSQLYAAPPVAQEPSHYLYGFPEYNGAIRWSLSDENQNGSAFVIRKPVFDAPPVPQGMVLVPVERDYATRAQALIVFNQARKSGDLDDALEAVWQATLAAAQTPC